MQNHFIKKKWNTELDQIIFIVYFILFILFVTILLVIPILPDKFTIYFNQCYFHQLTHLYCPGCGGTRAVESLLDGHLIRSFLYHPIPIYITVLGSIFLLGRIIAYATKGKINICHAHVCFLWLALILTLLNFFIKNYILLRYGIAVMK